MPRTLPPFVELTRTAPTVPLSRPIWDPVARAPFLVALVDDRLDGFIWDGSSWVKTHSGPLPGRLSLPFAAYSPALGEVVVGGMERSGQGWALAWWARAADGAPAMAVHRAWIPIDAPAHAPSAAHDGNTALIHVGGMMQSVTVALLGEDAAVVATQGQEGPWTVAYDEVGQRFVGCDGDSTYVLEGSTWNRLCGGGVGRGLAWDATSQRLLRFEGAALSALDGATWRPLSVQAEAAHVGAELVADPERRALILVGGQDFDERGGEPCADTFVSVSDASFRRVSSAPLIVGRYATAGQIAGRLAIVNHSSRTVLLRRSGLDFDRIPLRKKVQFDEAFDDRYTNYALHDDRIWALGSDGAIYRATLGEPLTRITPADPKLVRYAHRVALAWDAASERLVLYDAEQSRKTLVLHDGAKALQEIVTKTKPPRGAAGLVGTAAGLTLVTGGELSTKRGAWVGGGHVYRWRDDDWKLEVKDEAAPARTVLALPGSEALLLFGPGGLFRAEGAALEKLLDLPPELSFPAHTMNRSAVAAFDPVVRSLLVVQHEAVFEMAWPPADSTGAYSG